MDGKAGALIARWALALFVLQTGVSVEAKEILVKNQAEYRAAVERLAAGDTIILANGEWRDFEILLTGEGLPNQPITLTAQTKGKVFITGESNLRLAGTHLLVSGLVFKDGYTPTKEVIAFRRNKRHLARHSRVTEIVIDRFNNPERHEVDFWVMMYGRHNRFDHSMLVGKRNAGVTLAVRLDSKDSQENHHRIDHNYFGHRPTLGSNGGETLRIGTSHYSLTHSATLVERNYFEYCNGEVEIVSNKSGGNVFRNNVFFESQGTLTLRHGNGNLVEGNVFVGNGVPHTGGIRIINADQTIRNNHLEGLTGHRFGGALVIMNGVPNSPRNRYHRVEDVVIENNTIIDSDHIEFAAGSDGERSAAPRRTEFRRNLIFNSETKNSIAVHDDIGGIKFEDNLYDGVERVPDAMGFQRAQITLTRTDKGIRVPVNEGLGRYGAPANLDVPNRDETGPSWYSKPIQERTFGFGQSLMVEPGENSLTEAIAASAPGDVLALIDGEYLVTKIISLAHPISLKAREGTRPQIAFERTTLFEIAEGGSLELVGINMDGRRAPDAYGNSLIRTSRHSMLSNYSLRVESCEISGLDTNHSFDFLQVAPHTFARSIEIYDSKFRSITGDVIALDRETDDLGTYNGESIVVADSEIREVDGALLNIYRGGTDESTFGPKVSIRRTLLDQVGNGRRNKTAASVALHGAQFVEIRDNEFRNSRPIRIQETVGEPITRVYENRFTDTASTEVMEYSP